MGQRHPGIGFQNQLPPCQMRAAGCSKKFGRSVSDMQVRVRSQMGLKGGAGGGAGLWRQPCGGGVAGKTHKIYSHPLGCHIATHLQGERCTGSGKGVTQNKKLQPMPRGPQIEQGMALGTAGRNSTASKASCNPYQDSALSKKVRVRVGDLSRFAYPPPLPYLF